MSNSMLLGFDATRGHLFWPSFGLVILLIYWLTNSQPPLVVVGGILMAPFFLLLPIVMILVKAAVSARILATNPADCWQENVPG